MSHLQDGELPNASFPAPPVVLTFAASDPSGGAGVQADLMTLTACGCHALSVLTALTVQDTVGVEKVCPVKAALVGEQARAILRDIPVGAFKLGVLGSAENALTVAGILAEFPGVPVILDPIVASGRGDPLSDEATLAVLRDALLPLTFMATPNTPEAYRLAAVGADAAPEACARRLLDYGCAHVLLTGTHSDEDSPKIVHRLFGRDGSARVVVCPRLPGSYHGSGCTLASALAAGIARGLSAGDAAAFALDFTWRSLKHAFRPGRGQWMPNRMIRGPG